MGSYLEMSEREGQELSAEDDSNETVVGITIGGHHLIFILVLICLILLLSITVTLVCCLKSQWNNSDQHNTNKRIRKTSSNKSVNISKIHETKQTQTLVPEKRTRVQMGTGSMVQQQMRSSPRRKKLFSQV